MKTLMKLEDLLSIDQKKRQHAQSCTCFFPENQVDTKGKQRKKYTYENMMTPYDKLRSLAHAEDYLKSDMNFEILDHIAHKISDNQAADQLLKARQILFNTINYKTAIAVVSSNRT